MRPGNHAVPSVVRDDDAFWKFATLVKVVEAVKRTLLLNVLSVPLKVLLSPRSVEEAAVPVNGIGPFYLS